MNQINSFIQSLESEFKQNNTNHGSEIVLAPNIALSLESLLDQLKSKFVNQNSTIQFHSTVHNPKEFCETLFSKVFAKKQRRDYFNDMYRDTDDLDLIKHRFWLRYRDYCGHYNWKKTLSMPKRIEKFASLKRVDRPERDQSSALQTMSVQEIINEIAQDSVNVNTPAWKNKVRLGIISTIPVRRVYLVENPDYVVYIDEAHLWGSKFQFVIGFNYKSGAMDTMRTELLKEFPIFKNTDLFVQTHTKIVLALSGHPKFGPEFRKINQHFNIPNAEDLCSDDPIFPIFTKEDLWNVKEAPREETDDEDDEDDEEEEEEEEEAHTEKQI